MPRRTVLSMALTYSLHRTIKNLICILWNFNIFIKECLASFTVKFRDRVWIIIVICDPCATLCAEWVDASSTPLTSGASRILRNIVPGQFYSDVTEQLDTNLSKSAWSRYVGSSFIASFGEFTVFKWDGFWFFLGLVMFMLQSLSGCRDFAEFPCPIHWFICTCLSS